MKTIQNITLQHYFMRFFLIILLCTSFTYRALAQDPGSMMGGGIGGTTPEPELTRALNALNTVGVEMTRVNVYAWEYYANDIPSPQIVDNVILRCYEEGIEPMFLFEFYEAFNPPILFYNWYDIGYKFAERFSPNSPWLVSQGITDWGVSIYSAVNEPDIYMEQDTIPHNDYKAAMQNLANGVHAFNASLRVIPGGFSRPNSHQDATAGGYGTVLAPLFNNGTLDGVDLHVYNGDYAPMDYNYSAQRLFDNFKIACNITSDINYYCTEYNAYHTSDPQEDPAKNILSATWNQLTIHGNNGISSHKTVFTFPYSFGATYPEVSYGLASQLDPWIGDSRGQVIQNVASLTKGMQFVFSDFGFYQLSGSGKYMWVLQNRNGWKNGSPVTSLSLPNIPQGTTKLELWYADGLAQTIPLSGQTSYTVTGLRTGETVMILGTLANVALNKPSIADGYSAGYEPNKGNDGNASTFWNAPDWGDGHWWQVDLGTNYDLFGAELLWNGTSTTGWKYKMEASTDGTNWTQVVDKATSTDIAAKQNDNFTTTARYLRITHTEFDGVNWAGIKECKVFGSIPAPPDTEVPSAPTIISATANTSTSIDLTWSTSTDNGAVVGYDIFNAGTKINPSPIKATNYIVTGLIPNTSYTFTIKARDAAGNISSASNAVTVNTSPPDLVVTDISWSPVVVAPNDEVSFSAVVKNQGGTATPANTIVSVTFYVEGNYVTYSDNSSTSLDAGESRTLTANGGGSMPGIWEAGAAGTFNIEAYTDDVNRIVESNENNNTYSENMAVGSGSGGSLSANYTTNTDAVDLSAVGTSDWIHWGDSQLQRKANGGSKISDFAVIGNESTWVYLDDLRTISWSDGAPATNASNNRNGLYINGENNGFTFTLPASTTTQTANIYVGGWQSTGRLTLHLSDGSAPDYTHTNGNLNGQYDNNIEVSYRAASDNQTLVVTWVNSVFSGNVTLQGAALEDGNSGLGAINKDLAPYLRLTQKIEDTDKEFMAFPNPLSTHLNLQLSSGIDGEVYIQIMNSMNKKVLETKKKVREGMNDLQISLPHLASGTYFLLVDDGLKKRIRKLIIQ